MKPRIELETFPYRFHERAEKDIPSPPLLQYRDGYSERLVLPAGAPMNVIVRSVVRHCVGQTGWSSLDGGLWQLALWPLVLAQYLLTIQSCVVRKIITNQNKRSARQEQLDSQAHTRPISGAHPTRAHALTPYTLRFIF